MKIHNMTDTQLTTEANSLHNLIYIEDCFGLRDLINYELICKELQHRGQTIREELTFATVKA